MTRKDKPLTAEEAIEVDRKKAMEPFEPERIPPTFMYVSVNGVIQSGNVKLLLFSLIYYWLDEGLFIR